MYTQFKHYAKILCMKRYKKRTIALVLASVVTVAGSFATSNYKNTLMSIGFSNSGANSINMVLQTKTAYDGSINPIRKDANTYVLMLPEINSLAPTPDLMSVGNIDNVEIRTMPYTSSGKGYTKITVRTNNNVSLSAKNEIYIPTNQPQLLPERVPEPSVVQEEPKQVVTEKSEPQVSKPEIEPPQKEELLQTSENLAGSQDKQLLEENVAKEEPVPDISEPINSQSDPTEVLLLVMGIFVILVSSVFFYVKAKNKLAEIAGEQISIDVDEKKEEPEKKKKSTKIKNAIKNLDTKYPKPSKRFNTEYKSTVKDVNPTLAKVEDVNVVDLDELFQEQEKNRSIKMTEEEENQALEDFLSGFSFDDTTENATTVQEETTAFDEDLYEKTLNSNGIKFSNDDAEKINKLLSTEISDSTIKNIGEYAPSEVVVKEPSKQEILEDLVMTYTVSQKITFTPEDVDALYKIMSVEIDKDFLTDLRTNPDRTREMAEEIVMPKEKLHKPSEILTLSVKDMLPDLSEALRMQGGRRIESEVKPVTVYYSEGYEVSKLSLNDELPDLSVEINNAEAYVSKPSAEIQLVEGGYDVQKLENVSGDLPDLKDVMENPEKYAEPEQEDVVVDEEALLKNISNVQFKPFYDGSEEFEVLNDFDDKNAPSVSDIQKEFSQFGNLEISSEEEVENSSINDDYDDFESLYSNEFVDLDKNKTEDEILEEVAVKEEPKKVERILPMQTKINRDRKNTSEELIKKIEQTRSEREARKARILAKKNIVEKAGNTQECNCPTKCILEGESYSIIASVDFVNNMGCYLAKNEKGYEIIGYIGDKLLRIKQYQMLKSEKIQARISDKLPDGRLRYIVRIGIHKFIVDVGNEEIKYVMDLC